MERRPRMAAKKKASGKSRTMQWGSAEYLLEKFDDIEGVQEMSRKCVDTKRAKALVKAAATPGDNMRVHRVWRAVMRAGDEPATTGTIVHVGLGLNGPGRQADYLAALKRLVDGGEFSIFDAWIDAADDLADVLCLLRRRDRPARGR